MNGTALAIIAPDMNRAHINHNLSLNHSGTLFNDAGGASPRSLLKQLSDWLGCALLGHRMEMSSVKASGADRRCLCGASILRENRSETRIRHHVACFISGHQYIQVSVRDGHAECVCTQCGHPLLFETARSAYARLQSFHKKVRYRCNLFGHRVHEVIERDGLTEYACECGHSFLKKRKVRGKIRHPLICLFAGHLVQFVMRRDDYAEFLCRNCGHTFCV